MSQNRLPAWGNAYLRDDRQAEQSKGILFGGSDDLLTTSVKRDRGKWRPCGRDETRQDKTRQDEMRQDKTRQDKTRQDKMR
jgi:hypothetical protein